MVIGRKKVNAFSRACQSVQKMIEIVYVCKLCHSCKHIKVL